MQVTFNQIYWPPSRSLFLNRFDKIKICKKRWRVKKKLKKIDKFCNVILTENWYICYFKGDIYILWFNIRKKQ